MWLLYFDIRELNMQKKKKITLRIVNWKQKVLYISDTGKKQPYTIVEKK